MIDSLLIVAYCMLSLKLVVNHLLENKKRLGASICNTQ